MSEKKKRPRPEDCKICYGCGGCDPLPERYRANNRGIRNKGINELE